MLGVFRPPPPPPPPVEPSPPLLATLLAIFVCWIVPFVLLPLLSAPEEEKKERGSAKAAPVAPRRPPDMVVCPACTFSFSATAMTCPRCKSPAPPQVRKPIVGGNWKCNPKSPSELTKLAANINKCDTAGCEVYVCPSPVHVPLVSKMITNGAVICPQNANFTGCGAFTGETAVEQLVAMGIRWVLLGHSERREYFGETDEMLATKLAYALKLGLNVVFAIGEKKEDRQNGTTMDVCIAQMRRITHLLDPKRVVIAYEPVWAIGTGLVATPAQAQETHKQIREWIAENISPYCAKMIRIQYGGSANAKNAPQLSAMPDIDGFLVGGASLKPEFVEIVGAIRAAKTSKDPFPHALYEKAGLAKTGPISWAIAKG